MLQAVLWVDAIIRTAGRSHGYQLLWPAQTLEALTRASHWLFSMIDSASGRTPNLGANDGALILPLSATPFNDFRPTAQTAARAFLRNGLPAGAPDRKLETERGWQRPGHGSRGRRDSRARNRKTHPGTEQQGEADVGGDASTSRPVRQAKARGPWAAGTAGVTDQAPRPPYTIRGSGTGNSSRRGS
jgi:hypothetical protein